MKRRVLKYFKMIICLTGLAFLCQTSVSLAASASGELQAKLSAVTSLQANFNQVVLSAKGRVLQQTKGKMALVKPNLFRWYTAQPTVYQQLILADGKKLWVHDVSLEQVTVRPQRQALANSPILFLTRTPKRLPEEYVIKKANGFFHLVAKRQQAPFSQVWLRFDGKGLKQMVLVDPMGQRTEVKFSKVKTDRRLSPTLFVFKVPPGVDLIQS